MVLAFMFSASWRLTVVTLVMIPLVIAICKVYGAYYRKLSKKVQTELAEANSVAVSAAAGVWKVAVGEVDVLKRWGISQVLVALVSFIIRRRWVLAEMLLESNTLPGVMSNVRPPPGRRRR
jgi:ABC-type multidrug transport system fused ATPase/permease subunit